MITPSKDVQIQAPNGSNRTWITDAQQNRHTESQAMFLINDSGTDSINLPHDIGYTTRSCTTMGACNDL